ncbi:MAG TPA: hypothetical protein VMU16_01180 [Candidatus Binataceae bacterium]|nr:hypothetical protein [Candidatus Binataceae bacterium]
MRYRDVSGPGALTGFLIYFGISFLVFGHSLIGHFGDRQIGGGSDPGSFMWHLVWWPYALTHGLNPFVSKFVWAPVGFNLMWTTAVPLASLAMWPVTALFGPVVAFNIMMLLAPALAGWTAFLLCRFITNSFWPALLGGYVFGFFAYMTHEMYAGEPHTTLVFWVPLAVLVVSQGIAGKLTPVRMSSALAVVLAAQFLTSLEIFATLSMFGAIAFLIGWLFTPPELTRRMRQTALAIVCAYAVTAVLVSPALYWLFAFGSPQGEVWPFLMSHFNLGDLIFILPSDLPLVAITIIYCWRTRQTPVTKVLAGLAIIIAILMGPPRFKIHDFTIITPAGILGAVPLIDKALPFRFPMYSFLIFGIVASLWFRNNGFSKSTNCTLALLIILASIHGFSLTWSYPVDCPEFFTSGTYRKFIREGDNILPFPYGYRGNSMFWQASSGMRFRMAGGWTGAHPAEFDEWPIFNAFYVDTYMPDAASQLAAFLAHHDVDAAVIGNNEPGARSWDALFSQLSSFRDNVGGVTVYRLLPAALKPYSFATARQMTMQARSTAIDSLIAAAGQWIAQGLPIGHLSTFEAIHHGLLKPAWFVGSTVDVYTVKPIAAPFGSPGYLYSGAWLGGTPDGHVKIAVYGSYGELAPSIARFRSVASHIYFPYPHDLLASGAVVPSGEQHAYMEMEFLPDQIAAIAAQSRKSASQ